MDVIYKDIPGFDGFYRAGSDGSVWSCRSQGKRGQPNRRSNEWKKLTEIPTWYRGRITQIRVSLIRNGKASMWLVHRLVLEAFVGPCPEGMICRHFPDRNPTNNAIGNIRWGTAIENASDALTHGTRARGETQGHRKLSEDDVREIRRLYKDGFGSYAKISTLFGVTAGAIFFIVSRRNWKHVA